MILGLDLGTNSIGWSLLEADEKARPVGLIDCGSRIFQAGMEDMESPSPVSRAAARRDKRMIRRQIARRRRRMEKLQNILKKNGLLPAEQETGEAIKRIDVEAMKELRKARPADLPSADALAHVLPYYLRARALDRKVEPYVLGRIIYHLAHRRGFLSNRKNQGKDTEEGQVKESIAELRVKMSEAGARTLGEYFSGLKPEENRIRAQWTARDMYENEFNMICNAQSHLISSDLKKELFNAIFFQRKLKSQKDLIGECQLEDGHKRCPWYRDEAQTFRICQNLNNLRVIEDGSRERELNGNEWQVLYEALEGLNGDLDKHGNLTMAKAKSLIGVSRKSRFSIEEGGEKTLKGHQVNARLSKVFGERWRSMPIEHRELVIHDLNSIEKEDTLARRAVKVWDLHIDKARELSEMILPDDYCNLSSKAITKLLPDMKEGMPYATAVKKHYPHCFESSEVFDELPMVEEAMGDLRNPAVTRTLTQMRKVVNSIIRKHGLPDIVRVEVARDLKRSNKEKKRAVSNMRDNEKRREAAKKFIFEQAGVENPSREDVTRVLLAVECDWECPYTGRAFSVNNLLGESQFDIEHIIPFSRSLDNSFGNKTLCWHDENRNVKKNMTPFEAYAGDEEKYSRILAAVKKFKGGSAKRKLELFELQDTAELEDFSSRHLNDTRYISKTAMKYLGMLYGGINDADGKKRIQALSGGVTALVRRACGMNFILGSGEKTRSDHRHHAVDAIAIAMTSPAMVKRISDLAGKLEKEEFHYRFRMSFKEPLIPANWPGLQDEMREAIDNIIVSHYVPVRTRGPLHEETIYGKDIQGVNQKGKAGAYKHVRKTLNAMNMKEAMDIVDSAIRNTVLQKMEELGVNDPAKAFANPENLPVLRDREGKPVNTIKSAKFRRKQDTVTVANGDRARNVLLGNNHHMEIIEFTDKKGNAKWEGDIVSLLEAKCRVKDGEPIVKRDFGEGKIFKFSIKCGDIVELEQEPGKRELFIIRTVPQSRQISFVRLTDSRKQADIKQSKEWFTAMPNSLKDKNCRKVTVTPLGEVRRAND
jgi:CRISPR-associated endonuclease Csn1